MFKVAISVCLFVCPIITQEPSNRFASNFDWGTLNTREMFDLKGLRGIG